MASLSQHTSSEILIKFAVWKLDAELIVCGFTFSHLKAIISCPRWLYRGEMTHLHKFFHHCAGRTSCGTSTWGRGPSPRRYAGNPRYHSYMSLSKKTQLTNCWQRDILWLFYRIRDVNATGSTATAFTPPSEGYTESIQAEPTSHTSTQLFHHWIKWIQISGFGLERECVAVHIPHFDCWICVNYMNHCHGVFLSSSLKNSTRDMETGRGHIFKLCRSSIPEVTHSLRSISIWATKTSFQFKEISDSDTTCMFMCTPLSADTCMCRQAKGALTLTLLIPVMTEWKRAWVSRGFHRHPVCTLPSQRLLPFSWAVTEKTIE